MKVDQKKRNYSKSTYCVIKNNKTISIMLCHTQDEAHNKKKQTIHVHVHRYASKLTP